MCIRTRGLHNCHYCTEYFIAFPFFASTSESLYCDTAPTPIIADQDWEKLEPESAYKKKCRMTWAALIKAVYEAMH